MIRIVLALWALLLLPHVAAAASFDCAKAATSFETAICASPELSGLDDALAQAYATALGGLTPAATDEVKATQHVWLDYAARVCSDDAKPIAGTYDAAQTQCLANTFRARMGTLEASRMLGGFRFYPFERYLAEKDTDIETNGFSKVAEKHFETVRMDRDDDLASAFNGMTDTMREGYTELFAPDGDQLQTGDTTDDIDIKTTVKEVTNRRITLVTNEYWYGHGAAHGNYAITYDHFLIDEKRPLVASDIFDGADWEAKLSALVLTAAKARLGDAFFAESADDLPDLAVDPGRWDFSRQGLTVQFQPYEIASYADGAVTVTLPWSALTEVLAAQGREIATY
jgi:uncharacterized protein